MKLLLTVFAIALFSCIGVSANETCDKSWGEGGAAVYEPSRDKDEGKKECGA